MAPPAADLDDELVARALRWCAEAGRPCSVAGVRRALGELSWDELLSARALLADPPPAGPLGPSALADMARGRPAAEAAARERAGLYQDGGPAEAPLPPPAREVAAAARKGGRGSARRAAAPVVHRARDRVAPGAVLAPTLPSVDALFAPAGRAALEQLVRQHGARRAPLLAAIARTHVRGDGSPPGEDELAALLETHGLARGFAHRERDELLHALRAAGGLGGQAAASLGLTPGELEAALTRLDAAAEAERIRAGHREELRRRATLGERARLLATEPQRLAELGLAAELEEDLRARLPGHVRALRASPRGASAGALADSLAVGAAELAALLRRLGLDLQLDPALAPRARPAGRRFPAQGSGARTERPTRPARPDRGDRSSRPARPDRRERPGAEDRRERPGQAVRPERRDRPDRAGQAARPSPRGNGRPQAGRRGPPGGKRGPPGGTRGPRPPGRR